MKKPIAILGGTFDPIHFAHLRCAMEVYEAIHAQAVHFIPCKKPVHRLKPQASAEQRLQMLELALKAHPQFILDKREIERATPSYMFDTLTSLRQEFPQNPLVLIIGQDAFSQLHTWYRWENILSLSHILVARRPGPAFTLDLGIKTLLNQYETFDISALSNQLNGAIYRFSMTALDISATQIRNIIKTKCSADFLLPELVLQYILIQGLYR